MPIFLLVAMAALGGAFLLWRAPMEWWVVASDNPQLKMFARLTTIGMLLVVRNGSHRLRIISSLIAGYCNLELSIR